MGLLPKALVATGGEILVAGEDALDQFRARPLDGRSLEVVKP